MSHAFAAPSGLVSAMQLDPGAEFKVEVFADLESVTVWGEAPSELYERSQAVKATLPFEGISELVQRKLPKAPAKKVNLPIVPVFDLPGMLKFSFGKQPTPDDKDPSGAYGTVAWKLDRLVQATDLFALVPDQLDIQSSDVGGIQLGKISPKGKLLGGQRFELQSPRGSARSCSSPATRGATSTAASTSTTI
jgi:hypothetical protein